MKYLYLVLFFLLSLSINAQVLDSADLAAKKIYRSIAQTESIHPDSVFRLSIKAKNKIDWKVLPTFKNLQELRVNNLRLKELPVEICGLQNLTILDISKNKLSHLPSQIGQLENLTHLIANRNFIKTLPSSIKNLKNLRALDLWSNEIVAFPEEISELKESLQTVDMRVIFMNDDRKEKLQELLPKTTFFFSNSCDCKDN